MVTSASIADFQVSPAYVHPQATEKQQTETTRPCTHIQNECKMHLRAEVKVAIVFAMAISMLDVFQMNN